MGKYNNQQLQEMKKNEPKKYLYYSHEDDFNAIGIDIDSDDWELPIYHQAGPQGTRDKYTYFYDIVTSPDGATVVDPHGRIVNISNTKIKTVAEKPGNKPEFKLTEPGPAPRNPSRWLKFLNTITFGFYGAATLAQYNRTAAEYQEKTEKYNKELDKFNRASSEYEKRVTARENYRSNLEKNMGKNLDKVDTAIAEHAEMARRMGPINIRRFDIRNIVECRAHGRERLDFLMGPRLDAKKNERAKQNAIKDGILGESVFGSEIKADVLMDIKLPKCKAFSEHEIALLGFAAFSTDENLIETPAHPIPGRGKVEDKRTPAEKNEDLSKWYIRGEALFTRQQREISHAIPWVNNARADLAKALESYNKGRKSELAGILVEGLRKCTQHVMFHSSVLDSNTLADYATYAGEMLDIVNRDEELRRNMYGNGFTREDYNAACICKSIGKVWDRGIDAMDRLVENPELAPEEKTAAIVDIIGLRITQSMIYKHSQEISDSEGYTRTLNNAIAQSGAIKKKMNNLLKSNYTTESPEYIALSEEHKEYTTIAAQLQSGAMHNKVGLSIDFGKNIAGMYGDSKKPEELRNLIRNSVDMKKLVTLSNDDILMELAPDKSGQYVDQVLKPKEVREMENQRTRDVQIREPNVQIKNRPANVPGM